MNVIILTKKYSSKRFTRLNSIRPMTGQGAPHHQIGTILSRKK